MGLLIRVFKFVVRAPMYSIYDQYLNHF